MLTGKQLELLRETPPDGPNKLGLAMRLANLTQEQLAESIGSTQPKISRIAGGNYSRLPLEDARQLADFFGVPIEDLFPARDSERVAS